MLLRMAVKTASAVEADLAALRAAADRAGTSLACLFSCSDEFEAEIIRKRRAEGAYRAPSSLASIAWKGIAAGLLILALLLFWQT
jgi:hypothetical protein